MKRDYTAWSPARIAEANHLIQGEIGRRAADEGWILGLWDHCRNHRKLPSAGEIYEIKQATAEAREAYESMAHRPTSAREALEQLWATLEQRRPNLGRLARGETSTLVEDWR
jgi:hypothetical protein